MTRERRHALAAASAIAAAVLLYLGFTGGMIAMSPDRVVWPVVGGDPIVPRVVQSEPIKVPCASEFDCRFLAEVGR